MDEEIPSSTRPKPNQQAGSNVRVRLSNEGCEAGNSKNVGRVMEPRNRYSRGYINRSESTGESRRIGVRGRQQSRDRQGEVFASPPGSESGACIHRGGSGTGEARQSPCREDDRKKRGTGRSKALGVQRSLFTVCTSRKRKHEEGKSARYREASGSEATREGRAGVLAEHSTEGRCGRFRCGREDGEPRPKGPVVGKAKPGTTLCWRER